MPSYRIVNDFNKLPPEGVWNLWLTLYEGRPTLVAQTASGRVWYLLEMAPKWINLYEGINQDVSIEVTPTGRPCVKTKHSQAPSLRVISERDAYQKEFEALQKGFSAGMTGATYEEAEDNFREKAGYPKFINLQPKFDDQAREKTRYRNQSRGATGRFEKAGTED